MEFPAVLLWFGLAKMITYGACTAMAAAHYLQRSRRAAMPRQFGYFVAGLILVTAGEALGYAWQSSVAPGPVVAAAGYVALIAGTTVTVASVTAMSVVYRRSAAVLRDRALTDPLTGLRNRRAFFHTLEARIAYARHADQEQFAVAVLDLDNMKQINDTLGHLAGDEALKLAAEAIRRSIRDNDLACRYGGDEFAVLFARKGPSATTFSRRLSANVKELLAPPRRFDLSFSVGVACYPEDGATAEALVAAADARMYEHKRQRAPYLRLAAPEAPGTVEGGSGEPGP